MAKRKGTFLEESVSNLFKKAGFETEVNNQDHDFEVDVLAKKGDFKVIIECKQYDNSYLNISSLLHEWRSKGESANADRTLLIISGIEIPEKFYNIASQLGVYLMDDETIHYLLSLDKADLKEKLNEKIRFDEEEHKTKLKSKKRKKSIKWFIKLIVLVGVVVAIYFVLKTWIGF